VNNSGLVQFIIVQKVWPMTMYEGTSMRNKFDHSILDVSVERTRQVRPTNCKKNLAHLLPRMAPSYVDTKEEDPPLLEGLLHFHPGT
jgi:hypothetical protein